MLFYLISEHLFTWKKNISGKANKTSKKKKKRKPYKHAFHTYLTRGHKVFQPTCKKSRVGFIFCFPERVCCTLPVTSTALSPTGSSALLPRYAEETRHVPQKTTSPPAAPSVATHSSPSKTGRSLQTSTFAFSTGLLLATQSAVTPKSTVTPAQNHPKGLPARASIGRGEEQAHAPQHRPGKSRYC